MSMDENYNLEEIFVSLMQNFYPRNSFDKSDVIWEIGPTKHLENKIILNKVEKTLKEPKEIANPCTDAKE